MRRKTALLTAGLFLASGALSANLWAAQRIEQLDEDGDGRKETQEFWEGSNRVKAISDKNNDGKPDVFVQYKGGKLLSAELDRDYNGNIDTWTMYDAKEKVKRRVKDTNNDGKPDFYQETMPGGPILKEYDRNFDGRVDKRALQLFNPNKKIPIYTNRLEYLATPGYDTIWFEEDSDFDGKIDVYREKGNKEAGKEKIGKPIDTTTASEREKKEELKPKPSPGPGKGQGQRLVDKMNERFGVKE